MSLRHRVTLVFFVCLVAVLPASAAVVTAIAETCPDPITDPFVWCKSTFTGSGSSVTIEDLTGLGGDLESNQPLPTAAVLLQTSTDNSDRANIGLQGDYGQPQDIFASLAISYAYHKGSNPGQNAFAAPSLKLAFFNATCDDPASAGDCFGQLIYEPTWNQPGSEGSSVAVPVDTWTDIAVDGDNGLFWWTGGFGQPNTAGGPPLRTLNEWAALFSSDFDDSALFQVEIGVGSFNQLQLGYTDDVSISHSSGAGLALEYDFELPQLPMSGPATLALLCGLLASGLALRALRRRVTA